MTQELIDGEPRDIVYVAALESLRIGAPGLSEVTCKALAWSIDRKVALARQAQAALLRASAAEGAGHG